MDDQPVSGFISAMTLYVSSPADVAIHFKLQHPPVGGIGGGFIDEEQLGSLEKASGV
jgi:hypothetical protein